MKIKGILALTATLLISILYLSACDNNVGTTLEESIEPYLELNEIEGASNASVTINRGENAGLDSYFAFDVKNIGTNGLLKEGLTEGWCLGWDRSIAQNNDTHNGVEMYSTYGSEKWKPVNYLMNIKDDLKAKDPELTYKEIQVAIWSLMDEPKFDLDKVLENGEMPSRLMNDGQPDFSPAKVKNIVGNIRSNVHKFKYKWGSKYFVYGKHNKDDKQPSGFVNGETAWGFYASNDGSVDTNNSQEFCGSTYNGKSMPSNWGWSNGTFSEGASGSLDLYAGAAHCDPDNGTYVGTFSFTYENGNLNYTVDLEIDNDFNEVHIYASDTILPLHNSPNKDYKAAPGQLGHTQNISGGINSYSGDINGLSGEIFIAVHLGS